MKKLIYIANARIPTEKAHGIQIIKMCEAFAEKGVNVLLVIPKRKNDIQQNPYQYYKVKKNFLIKTLPCIDTIGWGKIGFYIQRISFAFVLTLYSFRRNEALYYTRGEFTALILKILGKKVVWEAHRGSDNFVVRLLSKKNINVVVISQALKGVYISYGFFPERIMVAPDAVDLKDFEIQITKEEARKITNLPLDKKIILYTGHLYDWKGVDALAESAQFLEENFLVVFVGGTERDLSLFRKKYQNKKNILILGQKPHQDIPTYLKSADVLVLPNSAKQDISMYYTSPMKLFEYMASGVPVIASDLPSIREIINESSACFFEPDNSDNLAKVVCEVLQNLSGAEERVKKAKMLVKNYTWDNRAQMIINKHAIIS